MTHTVIGIFDSKTEAQSAIEELSREGFIRENIDLSTGRTSDTNYSDTTTGTTTDTNTGIGDSISNFFSSLFGDDEASARTYTDVARGADAILTVQADSDERARQAAAILDRHGAVDVDERSAQYGMTNYNDENRAQYTQSNYADTSATTGTTQNTMTNEAEAAIPVIEENLQIGKREVERGGARIRSRVVERPVEEAVRLREEHVVVQRRPVNRPVTESDLSNFSEGDIEITERAEVPVVSKQARVVEEVGVGKQVEEREEVVRDTVRHTEVDVDETTRDDVTTDDNINTRRATR
jgi:uncharacterized protein (TIGR02271 family)